MKPNEITGQIVDAAYKIHTQLGPGLLESVYEVALALELQRRGLRVQRQVPVPVEYEGIKFDEGFCADLVVEQSVIVEIKSVEKNHPVHAKQLRTHLVLTKFQLGLVLNFGMERIKDGIVRMVNGLPEEPPTLADSQENPRRDRRVRGVRTRMPSFVNSFLGLRAAAIMQLVHANSTVGYSHSIKCK